MLRMSTYICTYSCVRQNLTMMTTEVRWHNLGYLESQCMKMDVCVNRLSGNGHGMPFAIELVVTRRRDCNACRCGRHARLAHLPALGTACRCSFNLNVILTTCFKCITLWKLLPYHKIHK